MGYDNITSLLSIVSVLQNYHQWNTQEYRFIIELYISYDQTIRWIQENIYYFVSSKLVCSVTPFKIEVGNN